MKAPRSLVSRLAWWFAASLLALYGIPAALVFTYASSQAAQYAALALKTEAETLSAYVAESGALDAPELREPEEAPFPLWLRITRNGRVLAQTPGTPRVRAATEAEGSSQVVSITYPSALPAYMVVRHQVGGKRPDLSVEAIGSMEPLLRQKRRLGAGLFLVGLVVIPVAVVGGRALAQRTLRPIGALVTAIRGLDPDRSGMRLPEGGAEEVAVLSSTFNGLLGRLDESVERMRRFTADASHEIRNPLGVLRTGIEITLRRERTAAEYQELLRENLEEIERLQAVVEGILLLAREGRSPAPNIPRDPVDLGKLVAGTAGSFAATAAERGVTVRVETEPDLVVAGDPALLHLVVFNLLDNALKHSPRGESVRVEARRQNGGAALLVTDHGPGVRPEDRHRVFERFFRGGPASGSGVGGLGLSVVRWVAEAHGGSARLLDSDRGAAFEVLLPRPPHLPGPPRPMGEKGS